MSDYDRGAYTPQTDAPLAFDPRRTSERRPAPMALIGSAAVLVILLAGVAMVYRGGVRHAGDSPRPVGEPVMAVKTAPTPAPASAGSNMDVYTPSQTPAAPAVAPPAPAQTAAASTGAPAAVASTGATGKAPTFAPPPEQPAARPEPKASTVAMLAKPSAPTQITHHPAAEEAPPPPLKAETAKADATIHPAHVSRPAKLDQAELAAAGGTRLAENDVPVHKAARAEAASDDDAAPAAAPAKPAASSAIPGGGKSAVVQIGAFSSATLADKGYAAVSSAMSGRMGGKAKHVQPLDKDGTTLYRTWLSGFASRADAVAFCEALKAKGKTCLVKG